MSDGNGAAGEDGLGPLLDGWRAEQWKAGASSGPPVRFVVEYAAERCMTDSELAQTTADQLGLRVAASHLFAPVDAELERFRRLIVEDVSRPDRADLFEVAAALRRRLGAVTVEPDLATDYFLPETAAPADPLAPESADQAVWCWADPAKCLPRDADWALAKTLVREAWEHARQQGRTDRGRGVVVFQPDTGIVRDHAELPPGILDDERAVNLLAEGGTAEDPMHGGSNSGHGTGTASVLASPEDGRMAGAAPLATLVPVRCVESVAVFDQSDVARAIDHARRNGAHVISISLGGVMSAALHAAAREAVRDNLIVLAAAGNCVSEVVWPARYPEVIAVGGVNEVFRPWRGSCRGPAVDIAGPAEFVTRANARDPDEPLAAVSGGQGTSFATALTAGIAALWLAYHERDALLAMLPRGRTLQEMFRNAVAATAQVPPGYDTAALGAGVVNALALLAMDPRRVFAPEVDRPMDEGNWLSGLASLVERCFGRGGIEAVAPVLADPQHAPEIACAALDRARASRTTRPYVESMPPPMLSPTLRARLAGGASALR